MATAISPVEVCLAIVALGVLALIISASIEHGTKVTRDLERDHFRGRHQHYVWGCIHCEDEVR